MSVNRDIDAELRFHFEARIEELVGQGMSRDDAHARAVEEFGDVNAVRSDLRAIDTRVARRRSRVEWLDGVRQDVVYAARSLRRAPAVSLTIILTLALGLGANAAMFSLLDVIFLRPPNGVVAAERRAPRVGASALLERGTSSGPASTTPPTRRSPKPWTAVRTLRSIAIRARERSAAVRTRRPRPSPARRRATSHSSASSRSSADSTLLMRTALIRRRPWRSCPMRSGSGRSVATATRSASRSPSATPSTRSSASRRRDFTGTELDATDIWLPLASAVGARPTAGVSWWQNANVNGFQVLLRLTPTSQRR